MLKRMLQALAPSNKIGFPEVPPPRPQPKPLPEAAMRHGYEPTTPLRGSTIGPMWIDAGVVRLASPRASAFGPR